MKQRECIEVFAHWGKPEYVEFILAQAVHTGTIFTVYQLSTHPGIVNPMQVFLLDCHQEPLLGHTPLLLVRDTTNGEPLALHLSQDGTTRLWEKPRQIASWIGICECPVIVEGPSDCIGADVIAISGWPEDDFYHVYVPVHLMAEVKLILQEWDFSKLDLQHRTLFRIYDVLSVRKRTSEKPLWSILKQGLTNAVYLEAWK